MELWKPFALEDSQEGEEGEEGWLDADARAYADRLARQVRAWLDGGPSLAELQDGLDALASQVALAVESATLTEDLHRRQSEARFRSLVQNSSDIVTVIDADTTIRYQTPSVERILGYGPEELVGTRLLDLIHPDDAPRVLSLLAGPRLEGGSYPDLIEFRLRHRE